MYRKLLIATDGSDLAGRAVTHGIALAKEMGATVVILTVTERWSATEMAWQASLSPVNPIEAYEEAASEAAAGILAAAEARAREAGVAVETVHVGDRSPAEGILEAATEAGCDLIVMATHGRRGLDRLLLGSQANEVLHYARVPVLVIR
jgi:nucleotide-binding universal stress UspA family protein